MKLGLISLGLWAASAVLAGIAMAAAAMAAGPSVAAGERALTAAGVFNLLILLAAVAGFGWASRGLNLLPRVLAIAGFAALEIVTLGVALVVTALILNR
jgi:hypothetical protein